jgi:hypothetical protein
MQGLLDEALADVGSVSVGGIDEADSQLNGTAQNCESFFRIPRLTPHPITDEAHSAESETVDLEITADRECPGGSGRWRGPTRRGHYCRTGQGYATLNQKLAT